MVACSDSDFSSTSSGLLERVRRKDAAAWTRLVSVYSPLVYFWCRKRAGFSPEDSADIVQNVFVAVSRSIERFQKQDGQGSFRGWLRVITANKIRDHVRRESRQPKAVRGTDGVRLLKELPADSADLLEPSEEDDLSERAIILLRVLEELRKKFSEKRTGAPSGWRRWKAVPAARSPRS